MEDIIETSPAHYVTYLRIYGAVVLVETFADTSAFNADVK
jgi:hypothetical protein